MAIQSLSTESKKSDRQRNHIVCVHDFCLFSVYASYNSAKEYIVVGSINECRGQSSQQTWLQRILPTTITITKATTPRQIIDAVGLHHHDRINYEAAKRNALGDDLLQQAEQFGLLPAYVDSVQAETMIVWSLCTFRIDAISTVL